MLPALPKISRLDLRVDNLCNDRCKTVDLRTGDRRICDLGIGYVSYRRGQVYNVSPVDIGLIDVGFRYLRRGYICYFSSE